MKGKLLKHLFLTSCDFQIIKYINFYIYKPRSVHGVKKLPSCGTGTSLCDGTGKRSI